MRAFARSLCRNAELADDIVQDACLKAWAARSSFIAGAAMRPWVFKIIRNVYAGYRRNAWRTESLDPADAEAALVGAAGQEWSCDMGVLQDALGLLSESHREAVIAVLVAGFTYEEAAQLLDCSEGTVKSRVSRGRELLAHHMGSSVRRRKIRQPTASGLDLPSLPADGLAVQSGFFQQSDSAAAKAA